ncbi:MAG: SpoIVB peptidase S55 domain-containing protein [Candidatus Hydrogenedentota bacterium]
MRKMFLILFIFTSSLLAGLDDELSWLKIGMKGYGLTVFEGVTPEKFNVEIIGFIENAFPKQDLILIKCSGKNLEYSGIVAGMSGSPIYINGRLIGAVGYGWGFAKEPICAVTPITNILREINRSSSTPITNISSSDTLSSVDLKPIETPLMVSGISNKTLGFTKELFKEYGFEPILGGGQINDMPADRNLYPGSALAVRLIKGDICFDAIGTVTYVDGDTIAAFGHPFLEIGKTNIPYSLAKIDYIFSSLSRSFKFGSAYKEDAGAIIGDRLACITGVSNVKSPVIPVKINVSNLESGFCDTFNTEVIKHKNLSPKLILISILEAISSSLNERSSNTIKVLLKVQLDNGKTIKLDDKFFSQDSGFSLDVLMFFLQSVSSPYSDIEITSVNCDIGQLPGRDTARLVEVIPTERCVFPGDTVNFILKLLPYNQSDVILHPISFKLPDNLPDNRSLVIALKSGGEAEPNRPLPFNTEQYIDYFNDMPKMDQIVVELTIPSEQIEYQGKIFKNLPPTYKKILKQTNSTFNKVKFETIQYRIDLPWILQGSLITTIQILSEVKR